MSLELTKDRREPWSQIHNSRILRRGDLLRLLGVGFEADIEILDSHDPAEELRRQGISEEAVQASLASGDLLAGHHHVLVRFKGDDSVVSTGMHIGEGTPDQLIFGHVVVTRMEDPEYMRRVGMLTSVLHGGNLGLYFMSDQADIHNLPEARQFLTPDGSLDTGHSE